MKTIGLLSIVFFLLSGSLSAQRSDVLITIGDHEVSKAEFERIYIKNNQTLTDDSAHTSPQEYLDMYINFKLKVIDAMNLKMDTVKSFREELAGYRTELAAPYLTDMQFGEEQVNELYERMKQEVNASHILFRVNPEAGKEQEQEVLDKVLLVRNEIIHGKDFNEAAFEYSEDPSAKSNKGHLGYFSAFQMVTPFENCAFNTPIGQVSQPVRTSFGYHLIKVHDVRQNQGEVKVAHIMKMFPREGAFDKSRLKSEIDNLYQQLLQGADFGEMAKKYSDDKQSAAQNGEMPWFPANRMVPEFSEPAFRLKNIGDITPPVETPYGYHIIKKLDHRPVPYFDDIRPEIEARIRKDPDRSSSTQKVFVEKLKQEYAYKESLENVQRIKSMAVDEAIIENPVLFTIDSNTFYLSDFNLYLQQEKISEGLFSDHFDAWAEYEIIGLEDGKLEEKYPDFKYLMQEYHDGLLFFNIMEEKIWKFAADDTLGLEKFYNDNPGKFYWEERFKGILITCKDKTTREEAEKYLEAQLPIEEVKDLLNQDDLIDIQDGIWEEGDNPAVDYFAWSNSSTADFNPELTFIRGEIIAPAPKTLEEAKGLYISAYQDFLDKQWVASLRKKYKIKVNKKLLKTVPHV